MANFAKRPQPYRVQYPVTPRQVEQIDEMFEILFKRIAQLQDTLIVSAASSTATSTSSGNMLLAESNAGDEGGLMAIPGPAGPQGPQGFPGVPGFMLDTDSNEPLQIPGWDGNLVKPEVGTWTPSDQSGGGLTFTNVTANYIKMGPMITVAFQLTFPATADANAIVIGGLPFISTAVAREIWGGTIAFTLAGRNDMMLVRSNTTNLQVFSNVGGTVANSVYTLNTIVGIATYQTPI